ncbi:MAG: DUF5681 domain-containing protein [Methylococcales bacterium]|nr:DUF5681 domain-containing protein [Methylococcales bacterium]
MAFQKGTSGNPKGRTPAHLTAAKVRKDINDDLPDILNKLIELAKGGDVQAIKLVLERVCPALKPQTVPISLPVSDSLAGQGNEIIRATMTGKIPPDIGSQLITSLANQAKIIEIDELTKRIEALEVNNESKK